MLCFYSQGTRVHANFVCESIQLLRGLHYSLELTCIYCVDLAVLFKTLRVWTLIMMRFVSKNTIRAILTSKSRTFIEY